MAKKEKENRIVTIAKKKGVPREVVREKKTWRVNVILLYKK
jgi:hypothetical protein